MTGTRVLRTMVLTLALASIPPAVALAQAAGGGPVVDPAAGATPGIDPEASAGDGTNRTAEEGVTPLVAPIPFKNTQVGWGLMLMGGLIHRFDGDASTKPSTGAVGGFYTENKSWGVMAMENARFAGDSWRARLLLSHIEVRYDFYGIGEDAGREGRSVGIRQDMNMATLMGLRRVVDGVYLGGAAIYMGTDVALSDSSGMGLLPDAADTSHVDLFAPGLAAEADTRDDDYWPTRGTLAKLKAWFFLDSGDASGSFQRYVLFWSWYTAFGNGNWVLAANLNACGAGNDTPFWALCSVGAGRGGLRGYTQGRYRDAVMTTEQVELRFHTAGRFGAAVFAGLGHVAPDLGGIFDAQVLPAGGLGLRYRLTRDYPMHLRFDYAWGRDKPEFYFSVSEAF